MYSRVYKTPFDNGTRYMTIIARVRERETIGFFDPFFFPGSDGGACRILLYLSPHTILLQLFPSGVYRIGRISISFFPQGLNFGGFFPIGQRSNMLQHALLLLVPYIYPQTVNPPTNRKNHMVLEVSHISFKWSLNSTPFSLHRTSNSCRSCKKGCVWKTTFA